MSDPKEAAIQRLAEAMSDHWDKREAEGADQSVLYREIARIAIEQGVVPVVLSDRFKHFLAAGDDEETAAMMAENPASPIPWSAVCAEEHPKVPCLVCGALTCTAEDACDGSEIRNVGWVCSGKCWDAWCDVENQHQDKPADAQKGEK